MTTFVSPAHIKHLLAAALKKKRVSDSFRDDMLAKLNLTGPEAEKAVFEYIESVFPGKQQELDDIYEFQSGRAVHLWRLTYLHDDDNTLAAALRRRRLVYRNADGDWQNVQPRAKKQAAVRKVRVSRSQEKMQAEIWLTKPVRFEQEELLREDWRTQHVEVRVTFGNRSGEAPIAEVYATQGDARNAIFGFLEWLRGQETPRRKSAAQKDVVEPLTFQERQVSSLAKRLSWGNPCGVRGPDPTGEVGEMELRGHMEGYAHSSLDAGSTKVAEQLKTKNLNRRYTVRFEHQDGFVEVVEVTFRFHPRHASLQFHTKTSRPAIDYVIGELLDEVGT